MVNRSCGACYSLRNACTRNVTGVHEITTSWRSRNKIVSDKTNTHTHKQTHTRTKPSALWFKDIMIQMELPKYNINTTKKPCAFIQFYLGLFACTHPLKSRDQHVISAPTAAKQPLHIAVNNNRYDKQHETEPHLALCCCSNRAAGSLSVSWACLFRRLCGLVFFLHSCGKQET